ncbi:peroxidase 5-like [Mercurialis annua]|uniref:peroxidase 5-like n=1 Tax=Mercurialis annua TaxID=3986 RepID=UPI00215F1AA7|nr:peroxidase 5-like [Mercurialis annua]
MPCCIILLLLCSFFTTVSPNPALNVGFYGSSCPLAEVIVRKAVNQAIFQNPGIGAGLIRMYFHDCFVRGCDASILLESTPGRPSERDHPVNKRSMRGFEAINEAKSAIEAICPNTVSCADILAFAARDSSSRLGGITYAVPAGRRDGTISNLNEVNLPSPFSTADQNAQIFNQKGLTTEEMVTLSGAHSVGIAHCTAISNRLYNYNNTHDQDPSLDPQFAAFLKTKCPLTSSNNDSSVGLDSISPSRLDNCYYADLMKHRGLFTSDQTLFSSPLTQKMVIDNAWYGSTWAAKFAKAMVHLGSIDVLTGEQGEIRRQCSLVN